MQILLQNLRCALQQLRRNPGVAVIAVATLALGIGAHTAIFSTLNAVMLRSLPVCDPQPLMLLGKETWVGSMDSLPDPSWQLFSYPFFREFRQENQAFSEVATISSILIGTHCWVAGGDRLEKIDAELAMLAMSVVALIAGYIPARRAAKVHPLVALRCE